MKAKIESVRDEVAKTKDFSDWNNLLFAFKIGKINITELRIFENEVAELYHARKCEEAGKELPTEEFIEHKAQIATNDEDYYNYPHVFWKNSATWMKQEASKLLAYLKFQLEAKEQELRESVDCTEHTKEVCDNYQKDLEAKDKVIEQLKQRMKIVDDIILKPELTNDQIHEMAVAFVRDTKHTVKDRVLFFELGMREFRDKYLREEVLRRDIFNRNALNNNTKHADDIVIKSNQKEYEYKKEITKLQSQLQEAKAEVEKLNKIINNLHYSTQHKTEEK